MTHSLCIFPNVLPRIQVQNGQNTWAPDFLPIQFFGCSHIPQAKQDSCCDYFMAGL